MSLFADILRDEYVDDDDIGFDETTGTWIVRAWELSEEIPGIPNKELALVIVRAIRSGFQKGCDMAQYS